MKILRLILLASIFLLSISNVCFAGEQLNVDISKYSSYRHSSAGVTNGWLLNQSIPKYEEGKIHLLPNSGSFSGCWYLTVSELIYSFGVEVDTDVEKDKKVTYSTGATEWAGKVPVVVTWKFENNDTEVEFKTFKNPPAGINSSTWRDELVRVELNGEYYGHMRVYYVPMLENVTDGKMHIDLKELKKMGLVDYEVDENNVGFDEYVKQLENPKPVTQPEYYQFDLK